MMNKPKIPCQHCQTDNWLIMERERIDKIAYYPWVCQTCGYISNLSAKKSDLAKLAQRLGRWPMKVLERKSSVAPKSH
jgi:hypothetical protein